MNPKTRIYFQTFIFALIVAVVAINWTADPAMAQTTEIPKYIQIHLNRVVNDAALKDDIILIEKMDIDAILMLLEHKNHRVASAAAYSLGEIRNDQAVPALIAALQSDRAHMRRIAAHALGKINDKHAVEPLILVLYKEAQPVAVQASAIMSLGRIGDPGAKGILTQLNHSPEKWLQKTATLALLKINTKQGLMVASAK